jgi:hypothetical protein
MEIQYGILGREQREGQFQSRESFQPRLILFLSRMVKLQSNVRAKAPHPPARPSPLQSIVSKVYAIGTGTLLKNVLVWILGRVLYCRSCLVGYGTGTYCYGTVPSLSKQQFPFKTLAKRNFKNIRQRVTTILA